MGGQKAESCWLAVLFGVQQEKQAAFVLSNLESKASRAQFAKSRKQKKSAESRKSLLSKSGWTLAAPISGGVRERPSKFPSQPKHTNQTHAPKYRLSKSELTYKYVINLYIYINIAVKPSKI